VIVLAFALIAILAPVISPYPRSYLAPDSDRFVVFSYSRDLPKGLSYGMPTLGPTTPLSDDRQGGLWVINYAEEGLVYMDFTRYVLGHNETPFGVGNRSLTLDVTQLNVTPDPAVSPPLRALYYMVPGMNVSGQLGTTVDNGALAFFSGREFVAMSPFTGNVFFHYPLAFDPLWSGGDPASAGEMLLIPNQRIASVGLLRFPVGPYRYFFASDGNHTIFFEIQYVHEGDEGSVIDGTRRVVTPGGRPVVFSNETLSAPPFVIYVQDYVTSADAFRSGLGQAFLLPLANNTLAVYNVSGKFRAWVPLTLDGAPASVAGQIGYVRSPELPPVVYLPLRSAKGVGVGIFDLSSLRILREFSFPEPSWEPVGAPISYRAQKDFIGFYDPASRTTRFVGFTGNGTLIPQVNWTFSGRLQAYWEVLEQSRIFLYTEQGKIFTMETTFSGATTATPELYALSPPTPSAKVRYAGTPAGTLYGGGLTPQELYGIWTDREDARTVLFQFLGTPRVPLPPGTYPSGNTYLLGTDFKGEDILTQLFWGTQIAFIVGLLAALFTVGIGTLVGLIAGYYGKLVDTLLMRTTDIFLVLPFLPIVLILSFVLRPSIWVIIFVIAILSWPGIARVIRSQVLTLKERPFIDAARVSGASDARLIFRHLAPNVLPFAFLYMSLTVSGAIITEAALSFLGLGDATVISWGGMLSTVLTFGGALSAWWWLLPPGLAITLLSLGFYLMGRGFDEIINPRLRRR